MERLLLGTCLASTWFMIGLIWFVQLVHYPLFDRVGREPFPEYHRLHTARTTWVVLGPMVLELASSIGLVLRPPAGSGRWLPAAGLAMAGICWLSTALVQVPLHGRLAVTGQDGGLIGSLVRGNAIRTACWTAHGVIVSAMTFAGRV